MILLRIQRVAVRDFVTAMAFRDEEKGISNSLGIVRGPQSHSLGQRRVHGLNLQETSLLVVQTLESAKLRDNDLSC